MCLFPPLALQEGSGSFLDSYNGISISSICGMMVYIYIYVYIIAMESIHRHYLHDLTLIYFVLDSRYFYLHYFSLVLLVRNKINKVILR